MISAIPVFFTEQMVAQSGFPSRGISQAAIKRLLARSSGCMTTPYWPVRKLISAPDTRAALQSDLMLATHQLRVGVGPQSIQIISPRLHHTAAFGQVLCVVVGCAHGIALGMCQLPLNGLMVPALLM